MNWKITKIPDLRICHREEGGAGNLSIDVTTEKRFESDIEEFFCRQQVDIHTIKMHMIRSLVYTKILCYGLFRKHSRKNGSVFAAKQSGSGAEILSCVQ